MRKLSVLLLILSANAFAQIPGVTNFETLAAGNQPLSLLDSSFSAVQSYINGLSYLNLTGPITSVGSTTSVASQTGTGSTFVMSESPTIMGGITIMGLPTSGSVLGTLCIDASGHVINNVSGNCYAGSGGAPYPSGSGIPVVVSGSAWGTTLAVGTGSGQVVEGGTITAAGPIGGATAAPVITYNAAGQLTAVSTTTITPAIGSITGLGTGISTALQTNTGIAGAPVLFNGALGTPSSGVATNLTGTASGLTVGTAGAVTGETFPASGLIVGTTDTQTLTNKTLTSPAITNPTVTGSFAATGLVTLADHATQAANTVIGNSTSGTASPTAMAVGSCSTASSALNWTTNTGFGCNTSVTAAAAPLSGITGLGANVGAALGVAIGSAGAPVLLNGTGGTPSSMTATNLTGTASGLTAGASTMASTASSLSPGATVAGSSTTEAVKITNGAESVNVISAAPAATTNLYVASGAVQYYTSNTTTNFVINLAWSSGTTFNAAISVGDSITFVLLVTQGATAYYATSIQVDGTTSGVTTHWGGGTAPSAGYASGVDAYTCSAIKTASATYQLLCALSQY